jgi:NTE family protein
VPTRALVLGGGGLTGRAWEYGLIAGLADQAIDLSVADLVVGTSAGAVVGACVASGADPQALYRGQLAASGGAVRKLTTWMIVRWSWILLTSTDSRQLCVRMGRLALAARTWSEADRLNEIAGVLPSRDWPKAPLKVTAVDARTGEFVVFDAAGPASLVDAVAASTAVPGVQPPVTIGDRRLMDGGLRSPANADLAGGFDRVVILSPEGRGNRVIPGPRQQARALAAARTVVVTADRAAVRSPFDPSRRAAAARAGYAQAGAIAEEVRAAWLG